MDTKNSNNWNQIRRDKEEWKVIQGKYTRGNQWELSVPTSINARANVKFLSDIIIQFLPSEDVKVSEKHTQLLKIWEELQPNKG